MSPGAVSADAMLIVAPEGRDASVLQSLLADVGIGGRIDQNGDILLKAIENGDCAGAIITDEAITRVGLAELRAVVDRQPTWSDFPFVILVRRSQGDTRKISDLEQSLNATILERPLHPTSLISAARSAVRGRLRQRLAARHLEELESARAELRQLAESLETKVRERTRDLGSANDRLTAEIAEREKAEARLIQAQKMEAVGQLTGGIAHDFNNLLTAVIGSLDLLMRRLTGERERKLASNALLAAERGAKLTAQLLAFSRRQRLSPEPLNANDVVSHMSDLLARSLGPRVRLETQLEPSLWSALADRTQLEMMILNLAINARDAMPSGGMLKIVTGNLNSVPPELRSELHEGEYVSIAVTDSGVGMPAGVAARAFEPFFTTKEPGKGTGLGLSQLYGFVRQSGGTARIDSREGQGSTVTMYLPRTLQAADRIASDAVKPNGHHGARILVVDDDDDVRAAAAGIVEELGYAVTTVDRGPDALDLIRDQRFDLVITDVMMPVMNGAELAREIKRMRPGLPVLFATGYADIEEFGTDLDGSNLVRKPFRMAELASHISEALELNREGVVDLDKARRERNS
ncbi:MAG TPA: response regulator [Sphingomicrobium sp.]